MDHKFGHYKLEGLANIIKIKTCLEYIVFLDVDGNLWFKNCQAEPNLSYPLKILLDIAVLNFEVLGKWIAIIDINNNFYIHDNARLFRIKGNFTKVFKFVCDSFIIVDLDDRIYKIYAPNRNIEQFPIIDICCGYNYLLFLDFEGKVWKHDDENKFKLIENDTQHSLPMIKEIMGRGVAYFFLLDVNNFAEKLTDKPLKNLTQMDSPGFVTLDLQNFILDDDYKRIRYLPPLRLIRCFGISFVRLDFKNRVFYSFDGGSFCRVCGVPPIRSIDGSEKDDIRFKRTKSSRKK